MAGEADTAAGHRAGDWETYFAWNFDDEQTRPLYFIPPPQSREAVRRWTDRSPRGQSPMIISASRLPALRMTQSLATWVRMRLTRASVRSAMASTSSAGSSARATPARRSGLLLRYYFQERRYQKVTIKVYSFNEASMRLHESLGFQVEGRLRRMVYTDGGFHDEVVYGMTVEEFREKHLANM